MLIEIGGKKILFIHIPKTGGTTIEDFFSKKMNVKLDWRKFFPDIIYGSCKEEGLEYTHLTMDQIFNKLNLLNISDLDFIFTVVRNPIKRFISECNWRKITTDRGIKLIKWDTIMNYDPIKFGKFDRDTLYYCYIKQALTTDTRTNTGYWQSTFTSDKYKINYNVNFTCLLT